MDISGREEPAPTGDGPRAPWPAGFVAMTPSEQLAAFLVKARAEAATPRRYPRRGSGKGITREQMAEELDISLATYVRLETNGAEAPWSRERASAAADVLGLNSAQRQVFYTMALGIDRLDLLGVPALERPVRMLVDDLFESAMVVDPCTKILHRNESLAYEFPDLTVGTNLARWVLVNGPARFTRWRTCWVVPVIDCLIASRIAAHPDWVEAIAREADSIRALSPVAAEIWRLREAGHEVPEDLEPAAPDASPARDLLPMESLASPGYRVLIVVPALVAAEF